MHDQLTVSIHEDKKPLKFFQASLVSTCLVAYDYQMFNIEFVMYGKFSTCHSDFFGVILSNNPQKGNFWIWGPELKWE